MSQHCPIEFSLDDLQRTAEALLENHPDPVVVYRLRRDVLRLPQDDPLMQKSRAAARQSAWVRQVEAAQLADGSWGRYHTQDSRVKAVFCTSEEAIQRALSLGMDIRDAVLERAERYILRAMNGEITISDPPEKNDRVPLGLQLITGGRLAQLDPQHPAVDRHWRYWMEVARSAFTSGCYRLEDEEAAYPRLSGILVPKGYLRNQYALWILPARPLPPSLDAAVTRWLWEKPEGIYYIGVNFQNWQPNQAALWFRQMDILSGFSSWLDVAAPSLNNLWRQRSAQGLWDFGPQLSNCIEFPLSENWRTPARRQADFSTRVLGLLRKVFD